MTVTAIIETHRLALLRLVVMLFEASGLVPGKPAMLTRIIRGTVLYSLRPMEAAGRRLVVVLADQLKRSGYFPPTWVALSNPIPSGGDGPHIPAFALFDARRCVGAGRQKFAKHGPRIFYFDGFDPINEAAPERPVISAEDPLDAMRLCNRLEALKRALEDLPKQARRMVRLQVRREKTGKGLARAMRPGRPPGHRSRGKYEADEILCECHQLALMALAAPDTS